MWTSQRRRETPVGEPPAELGEVTLGGDPAGVNLGGERRWLPVYSPGGYSWRPRAGDRALVLKTGQEGECPCVLGTAQDTGGLEPGEVRIRGGQCELRLGRQLDLNGNIYVNGQTLEDYIVQIVIAILTSS